VIDRDVRSRAADWLAAGRAAVVVEVAGTEGSAPREAGARMLVAADARVGTIGGGHLELQAIAAARALLARHGGAGDAFAQRFALGPSLGQCCGGAVTLAFAPLDAESLARWPNAAPLFHLQLHGAGHVGRAIASALAPLDVAVDWFDPRDEEFPATTTLGTPWPARVRRVAVDTIEAEVRHAPPGAFFLVLTHEHALDLRIVEAILRRGDFAFCGLIGSKTKRAKFVRRLEARGVPGERIARVACPIGIDGIDGKAPEVIAAAVVAQLLVAHGRTSRTTIGADAATTAMPSPAPGARPAAAVGGGDGARVLAPSRPLRRPRG
jgi:xanthine dehydrogenase accessory factor